MKFVSVRGLRGKPAQPWQNLKKQRELVVTSNGKPIAIISSVSEDTLEESLKAIRRSRAIEAVDALQKNSVEMGTNRITLEEINEEIAEVREARIE